ncbi:hypothetical protein ABEV74_07530 [Paenibacillus cisolokensis]|uniref:hypothetical protein n=1 Tax=Paenibacillus cisolokensis TaxID=1658519 RepID=UPI003D2CA768
MENQSHKNNYKGTTRMNAKNQDMAFVNDTVEDAKSTSNFSPKKKTLFSKNCCY